MTRVLKDDAKDAKREKAKQRSSRVPLVMRLLQEALAGFSSVRQGQAPLELHAAKAFVEQEASLLGL